MRPPLVRVMNLRRKTEIAIEQGLARDREDLAAKLRPAADGRSALSAKTLDWWINGDGSRAPEMIPADAFDNLVALFGFRLDLPDAAVRELMRRPADHLADALGAAAGPALDRIIARDATRGGGYIALRSAELSLSAEEQEPSFDTVPEIPLGEPYRIVFPSAPHLPFAIVLQNAGHAWGALKSELHGDGKRLLVPGMNEGGSPRYLVEREQEGAHRFIAFQAKHPFPATLADYRNLPIALDRQALQLLAAHYEAQPARDRACCLLEVAFRVAR